MKTIEKNLKTDGKKFKQVPSNTVHDKILQNLDNPTIDYNQSRPKSLIWLLPIAIVVLLVTVINVTLNTPNISSDDVLEKANVDKNQASLNLLVKNIENDISSEIENEQTAILNDIKQFNKLFLL